ncbi:hypothetical protein YC2023_011504 [Brassica napus]
MSKGFLGLHLREKGRRLMHRKIGRLDQVFGLKKHMFFKCELSKDIWTAFFNHNLFSAHVIFEDVIRWLRSLAPRKKLE